MIYTNHMVRHLPNTTHSATPRTVPLVLVVEDDLLLAQTIELYLRKDGFTTERVGDGVRALELFRAAGPELVILDLGLPKLDGLEVLRGIRAQGDVPVIILTARAEEVDELLGLGLGADNYLIKPVSARKLMAHVKAVLRRGVWAPEDKAVLRVGGLEVDGYGMKVRAGGQAVDVTPTEFRLLHHLASTPGRAISRAELYEAAMPESEAYERAVDVHMVNIRRKLRGLGMGVSIETVRGIGYRLSERP